MKGIGLLVIRIVVTADYTHPGKQIAELKWFSLA